MYIDGKNGHIDNGTVLYSNYSLVWFDVASKDVNMTETLRVVK
jgi:hypothetical protein